MLLDELFPTYNCMHRDIYYALGETSPLSHLLPVQPGSHTQTVRESPITRAHSPFTQRGRHAEKERFRYIASSYILQYIQNLNAFQNVYTVYTMHIAVFHVHVYYM